MRRDDQAGQKKSAPALPESALPAPIRSALFVKKAAATGQPPETLSQERNDAATRIEAHSDTWEESGHPMNFLAEPTGLRSFRTVLAVLVALCLLFAILVWAELLLA